MADSVYRMIHSKLVCCPVTLVVNPRVFIKHFPLPLVTISRSCSIQNAGHYFILTSCLHSRNTTTNDARLFFRTRMKERNNGSGKQRLKWKDKFCPCNFKQTVRSHILLFSNGRSCEYATRILVSVSVINFGIYVSLICYEQPKKDIDQFKVVQNNKPNINVV